MASRFGDWVTGGGPDPYERYCVAAVVAFLTCVVATLIAAGFQRLEFGGATPMPAAFATGAVCGVVCGAASGVVVFGASYFLTGPSPLNRWVVGALAGLAVGLLSRSIIAGTIDDGSLPDWILGLTAQLRERMRDVVVKAAIAGNVGGVITGSIAAAHLIVMGKRTPQTPATNAA